MRKLFPLLFFLAACNSDPVSAPVDSKKLTAVVSNGVNLTLTPSTDEGIPTTPVQNSNSAAIECWNRVNQPSTPTFVSHQMQSLVFDTISGRPNSGVVGWAKLRLEFKGYLGTYAGQPLKCTSMKHVTMTRLLLIDPALGTIAQRKTEFNFVPLNGWNWCWGTGCNEMSAPVRVQALVRWTWPTNQDCVLCSQHSQDIVLGGTDYFSDLYGASRWEVAMYPSGYWTAWDYGGNGSMPYGYYQWGPTGWYVDGIYEYDVPQFPGRWYSWRPGQTHWTLTNLPP